MTEPELRKEARRNSQAHKWGGQLRREFDTLYRATEGLGASALFEAISTEAVIADTGELCDSAGREGYAWNPESNKLKGSRNPASERVKSAGASLGRVLAGGHPDHRSYLAFLQAIYVVTTQQDYDVAARIEMLWDQMAYDQEETEAEEAVIKERSWIGRLWHRFVAWWQID
jgi:hypothetical protein